MGRWKRLIQLCPECKLDKPGSSWGGEGGCEGSKLAQGWAGGDSTCLYLRTRPIFEISRLRDTNPHTNPTVTLAPLCVRVRIHLFFSCILFSPTSYPNMSYGC